MILVIGGRNQGKREFVSENFGEKCVVNGFHWLVRNTMLDGGNVKELAEKIKTKADIVISDEIGCGIVPAEGFDRSWREETGRALCFLAREAEAVYRVTAGIAVRIK